MGCGTGMKFMRQKVFRIIVILFCGIFVGSGVGYYLPRHYPAAVALQLAREEYEQELFRTVDYKDLAISCAHLLELGKIELHWREMQLKYSVNYPHIASEYDAWCQFWHGKYDDEKNKTSEFAGGSFEPIDRNVRLYFLLKAQLEEFKIKWQK